MSVRGWATACALVRQGSELTAAVSAGGLVLPVENTDDFDDEGGIVELNGERLTYSEGAVDEDASTITVDVGPAVAAAESDRVFVIDGGQVATDYTLFVSLGEGDEAEVDIPFEQRPLWPEGEYDDPVQVLLSDDLERVLEVPGRTPVIDDAFNTPTLITSNLAATVSWPHSSIADGTGWPDIEWTVARSVVVPGRRPIIRTAPTLFEVPENGIYAVQCGVGFASNSTGSRGCAIWLTPAVGGADVLLRRIRVGAAEAGQTILEASRNGIELKAGDKVFFEAFQNSGAALDLLAQHTNMSILRVAAL